MKWAALLAASPKRTPYAGVQGVAAAAEVPNPRLFPQEAERKVPRLPLPLQAIAPELGPRP